MSNKTHTIVISVGHKRREFEYVSFLAAFLELHGYHVKVVSANFEVYGVLWRELPDIFMVGQVNQDENISAAKFAHALGIKVVVLNCEGTYDDTQVVRRFGDKVNSYVDVLIAWGKKHEEDALKFSDISANKIFVCGSPKFDFFVTSIYQQIVRKLTHSKSTKKTICISTAFSTAENTWEEVKNNAVYRAIGEKKVKLIINQQRKLRDAYIALAIQISQLPNWKVVFRTHPLEDVTYYQEKLAKHSKIIFDNVTPSSQALSTFDLVIHRTSTLALEAWCAHVPTASYDPIKNADGEMLQFTAFNPIFYSEKEIIDHLKKEDFSIPSHVKQKRAEFLQYWTGVETIKPRLASQTITQVINQLIKNSKLSDSKVWRRVKGCLDLYLTINFMIWLIRTILGYRYSFEVIALFKGSSYLKKAKNNYITSSEVFLKKKFYKKIIMLSKNKS